jgi:SP family sugar:H+ symporter-like MFS transporter
MLAFFTPFITADIEYAYGYVFAGCNLAAFAVVFFFLIESSGKTLEEVDEMYLLHVRPIGSAKFEFDEETRRQIGELGTDRMDLEAKGFGTKKREEGGVGGVLQKEEADLPNLADHSGSGHPITSSGGNGRL